MAAFLFSSAPAVVLGLGFFGLIRLSSQLELEIWPDFILRLLSFVTTCVWVTWPVLSAGVDDHSELSRYSAYPISTLRLMLASTLASLAEPRSLVFYGPLVGATLGYLTIREVDYPLLIALGFAAYVMFNAALSRVGLHVVLTVLRQQRSAELIGAGFFITLVIASFIPPVDTSWLFNLGKVGVQAVPDTIVEDATRALGRFPTGFFAHALWMSALGDGVKALVDVLALIEMTIIAMVVAWGLLIDFHRNSGRAGTLSTSERASNPFVAPRTLFGTLVVREAVDLWHNPRARLLVAVPFVLGILFKLLSGRALFVFFLGDTTDAWLLGGLCVYGAIVMGSTFSQNAFAYDGHGFSAFVVAPIDLGLVLRAKNVVHASAARGPGGAGGDLLRGVLRARRTARRGAGAGVGRDLDPGGAHGGQRAVAVFPGEVPREPEAARQAALRRLDDRHRRGRASEPGRWRGRCGSAGRRARRRRASCSWWGRRRWPGASTR